MKLVSLLTICRVLTYSIVIMCLPMSSCESTEGKDFNSIVTPLQQIEEMPSKTWRHSTPEAQGIDSNQLAEMITYVKKQDKGLESITIIRN